MTHEIEREKSSAASCDPNHRNEGTMFSSTNFQKIFSLSLATALPATGFLSPGVPDFLVAPNPFD